MFMYRVAVQDRKYPNKIHRYTIVAAADCALPIAAKLAKITGNAYLLSIAEDRPAQISGELELV